MIPHLSEKGYTLFILPAIAVYLQNRDAPKTRPPVWTKRQILNGILYQLKNGCNWSDLPRDLPPYSTVFWHYQNWCEDGVLDRIMTELHGKVREQVKKNRSGQP